MSVDTGEAGRHSAREGGLAYAARGWHVLPLRPGTKVPATKHGFKDAATDAKAIRRWSPDANVGIATVASGLLVLDIDPRAGGDATLTELESEHGLLPETLAVATPSGGRHYYFLAPTPDNVQRRSKALGSGIDLPNYVVAPPSHLEVGDYAWLKECEPVPAPEWLVKLAAGPQQAAPSKRVNIDEWLEVHTEGDRNATLARLVGSSVGGGLPKDAVLREAHLWNRTQQPPLPTDEVDRVVESIWQREHSALKALGFTLDAQIQFGRGPDATYQWVIGDVRVDMGTAQDLMSLSRAQARLYSEGYELPAHINTKAKWLPIVNAARAITRVEDVETRQESLESAIRGYLGSVRGLVVQDLHAALAEAPSFWEAFIDGRTGEGLMRLPAFIEWCRLREDSRWTAEQVGRELYAIGEWPLRQPRYGKSGKQVKARVIPMRITAEFIETWQQAHSDEPLVVAEARAVGDDAMRVIEERERREA